MPLGPKTTEVVQVPHDLGRAWGLLRKGYVLRGRAAAAPVLEMVGTAAAAVGEGEGSSRPAEQGAALEAAGRMLVGTTDSMAAAAAPAAAAGFVKGLLEKILESNWPLRPHVRDEMS